MPHADGGAMPSAGSNHRTGRRRPRAAASVSGADQPLTLWSVARTRTPTSCHGTSASGEQRAVGVERGLTAEVGVEHRGGGLDFPAADHVDEPGHGFALIDRVGDHAFGAGGEPHRVQGGGVGNALSARAVRGGSRGRRRELSAVVTLPSFVLRWVVAVAGGGGGGGGGGRGGCPGR